MLAAALAALQLVPIACASPRPPSLRLHVALRSRPVAVVPARFPVADAVELFAKGRAAGAFRGAGRGAVAGVLALGAGGCGGDFCGALLLLAMATAVVVGSAAGAVAGAFAATPEAEARRIEEAVQRSVAELPAHLDLARRVLAAGEREGAAQLALVAPGDPALPAPDPAALREQGFDRALEIGVRRVAFVGGKGSDPELGLELRASVRLVDTRSGAVDFEREFRRTGAPRRFSAWSAAGAEPLRRALDEGLDALADQVSEALFAQVDLGIASGTWAFPGTARWGSCWLVPTDPPNEYPFLARELRYTDVRSLQPTLRWEPFPDAGQRVRVRDASGLEIGEVRYQLRIWSVRGDERGPLVYERRALPAPAHRLEQPLLPRHRYFWSVRACFGLGEDTACTPWASSLVPSRGGRRCESPEIPPWNYFRFRTF